ncbi:MAG: leucine-rich repeat domain-containing protein [Clostridiales bacterium]|nr:leucine-rich repeat domain-containing protein [Clostridiales bacterium]
MSNCKSITAALVAAVLALSLLLSVFYARTETEVEAETLNNTFSLDNNITDYDASNTAYNDNACMTILVHGVNESAAIWSGDSNGFEYEEDSLIEQLAGDRLNTATYMVNMQASVSNGVYDYTNVNCDILELTVGNGSYQYGQSITDINYLDGKHRIFIYNDANDDYSKIQSDEKAYYRLKIFINNLIVKYKLLGINNPTVNIIAHGRGGIISLNYITNYPNNVAKLVTIGTNYNGSSIYQFAEKLSHINSNIVSILNEFGGISDSAGDTYPLNSMIDGDYYKNNWNNTNHQTKVYAIGASIKSEGLQELKDAFDVVNSIFEYIGSEYLNYENIKNSILEHDNWESDLNQVLPYLSSMIELYIGEDLDGLNCCINSILHQLFDYCTFQESLNNFPNIMGDQHINRIVSKVMGVDSIETLVAVAELFSQRNITYVKGVVRPLLQSFINTHYDYSLSKLNYSIDSSAMTREEFINTIAECCLNDLFENTNEYLSAKFDIEFLVAFIFSIKQNIAIRNDNLGLINAELVMALSRTSESNLFCMQESDKRVIFSYLIMSIDSTNKENKTLDILHFLNDNSFLIDLILHYMYNAGAYKAVLKTLYYLEILSNGIDMTSILITKIVGFICNLTEDEWTGLLKILSDIQLESDLYEASGYSLDNYTPTALNIKALFTNDGVNSLSSQLGDGYNGFYERKVFLFDDLDCRLEDIGNINYPIPIPHNVQCQNNRVVEYIADSLNIQCYGYQTIDLNATEVSISSINVDANQFGTIEVPSTINGKTVVKIEPGVFNKAKYSEVTSIVLPNTIREIGAYAFANCSSLTNINIPTNVTEIKDFTFFNCSSLDMNLNDFPNIRSIGYMAFYGTAFSTISIGQNVVNIGEAAFANCESLYSISVHSNNSHYASSNSVLFTKDYSKLIQYPIGRNDLSYSIDSRVETIGKYAFYKSKLSNVAFNEALNYIEEYAFANSNNITSITLKDNLLLIKSCAFRNCSNLDQVILYDSTPNIAAMAFDECDEDIMYYVPFNQLEDYQYEPGLIGQEDNITSITYNITLWVDSNEGNCITLDNYKYGTPLSEALEEIGIYEIENGDLVFDGWRYERNSSGNGTGLNVFNENDYHEINTTITLYAKWIAGQYYIKVEQFGSNLYLTPDGMDSNPTPIVYGQETQLANIYWDWFIELTQLEGQKILRFELEEYEESDPNGPSMAGESDLEHYYSEQFASWVESIVDLLQKIPENEEVIKTYVIIAKLTPKTFTFIFDTDGGAAVGTLNIEYAENANLPIPVKQPYEFNGWKIMSIVAEGDATVYPQYANYLGRVYNYSTVPDFTFGLSKDGTITLKALWGAYYIEVRDDTTTTINHYSNIILDFGLQENNKNMNKEYIIGANVNVLSIRNMNSLRNVSFIINATIDLYLENVCFSAAAGKSAINASGVNLTVYSSILSVLKGGERQNSTTNAGSGIVCKNLTLYINGVLNFEGGAGKDGGQNSSGVTGGYGAYITGNLSLNGGTLFVIGGNGGSGGVNTSMPSTPGKSSGVGTTGTAGSVGKQGGNGGIGIYVVGTTYISNSSRIIAQGGSGGRGGKGGHGGNGGEGADGRIGFSAKQGGDGGSGGRGGTGGNSGLSALLLGNRTFEGTVDLRTGSAGIGGSGGYGGVGGLGGIKLWSSSRAASGANGSTGAQGYTGSVLGNLY